VDQEHVRPLLELLQQQYRVSATALIVQDLHWSWTLLLRLPPGDDVRTAVGRAITAADAKFPGIIQTEWGHQWLAVEFVDAPQTPRSAEAGR
jgi:hypothetical protein